MATQQNIYLATRDFVRRELAGNDASHDWEHVNRVCRLARDIAREETASGAGEIDAEIVELAALLHDVDDWKYSGVGSVSDKTARFLMSQGYPAERAARVLQVIREVGFKSELGSGAGSTSILSEARIVQDADRLDALGAIGIARAFVYGGRKGTALYDPKIPPEDQLTGEKYADQTRATTIVNHFHEKLLKLRGLMKTDTGRRLAAQRHQYMEEFLAQFIGEWEGQI
jgi:uncharacterized protein